jgi:hypothetical protein
MTATLIGLGHRSRSGKDSAAAEILKWRGTEYKIEVIPFAKALKEQVNAMAIAAGGMEKLFKPNRNFVTADGYYIDFPDWVVYDTNPDMNDPHSPLGKQRTLLQFVGTEVYRSRFPNYWVDRHREAVEKSNADYILVPDMRFENEMSYIKQHGFAVRVDRPNLPPATHASETALEDVTGWDYILENGGSLERFKERALAVFDDIAVSFAYGFGV